MIHVLLPAEMWPPPLPAAPVIKLKCSAVQCTALHGTAVQGKNVIQNFRDTSQDHNLALGSERESIGIIQAEQLFFLILVSL